MQLILGGAFLFALAVIVWRKVFSRRAMGAQARERDGRGYTPDPLAHLDVKRNDRSIVDTPAEILQRDVQVVSRVSQPARMSKPGASDYQFEIEYEDRDGKKSKRRIAWVFHEPDGEDTILHAYCELAQADRKFRSSRILSCKNLWTGRQIKDLGRYFRSGSYLR